MSAVALLWSGCGGSSSSEAPAVAATAEPKLETVEQRVSYGMGYNMSSNLSRMGMSGIDRDAVLAGITDGLAGAGMRVEEQDLMAAFSELQARAQAAAAKAGEENIAKAKTFLEQNRQKAGVQATASGLQYEVLQSGTGPKPKPTDTVEVHYHGTLIDGTVFDSSVQRGESIQFPVTGVIPGWIEALQLMSVGDKWRLTIPPELAYGARATGKIPANSALVFEVELLGIK